MNKHFGRGAVQAKWTALRTITRRATLLMVPISLVMGGLLAAVPTQSASARAASRPSLKWINSTTVQISGGDVKTPLNIVTGGNLDPANGLAFSGEGNITHVDGCQIGISIGVDAAKGGGTTDYSKASVWPTAPSAGTNCFTDGSYTGNDANIFYQMGFENGKSYAVANVNNRGTEGDTTPPPQVDDPEDKQIINVKLDTGWKTVYTTPNPSNPPKAGELVPQEDLWVLCGNANEPTKSWDPYRNNVGTPDYAQMEKDCLARKGGWVITTTRGPIKTDGGVTFAGQFTGVKYGKYVVCDYITNSCQDVDKQAGKVLTVDNWKLPANPTATVPGSETDANGTVEEPELACDITFDITTIFSLKWLVCPIIDTATFAVGKLEDVVNSLLTIDVKDIFDDSKASNPYHVAWNSFRFFALGLVVVAALIMVVSQAAGVEILDAYTVRKVLPRLLFAAIFIALSWDILEFLAQLSNDAGTGIRTLIYAPFQALNKDNQLGGGSSFVLALIGTGGALAFGWIGLLTFALTGLLAALVAFAILVFRKMLILLLVMTAPFAIACYILPNTQKGWTIWKDGLLSVLIVFPIISAFIAIGRVFAVTSYNAPGNQTINQLIAVIAYFAPYFLISMAFRLAGGFIATVGGVVNDRSRGAFDRLKNMRGNKLNENMGKMKEGRRFADSNPFARTFNTATLGAGTGVKGRFGLGGRGQEARDQTVRNGTAQIMKSAAFAAVQDDDPVLQAATYGSASEAMRGLVARGTSDRVAKGMNADQARTEAETEARRAVQGVQTSIGFGRGQQVAAAQQLVSTGTGFNSYTDASGRQVTAAEDMVDTLARASGGNTSTASSLAGFANFQAKAKGRHDLAPGYGKLNEAVQRAAGTDAQGRAPLTPADYHADEGFVESTWRSADPVTLMRDRTPAVKNFLTHWEGQYQGAQADYQSAQAAGNTVGMRTAVERAQKAETALYEMEQSKMYGSGENVSALNETLENVRGQRQWLEGQSNGGNQIAVHRRGDDRNTVQVPDPANPGRMITTHEDPNKFYQDLRNPTLANEARSRARVMQRGQQE